jgi:hypothetical protein
MSAHILTKFSLFRSLRELTRGVQIEGENGPAEFVYKLLALEPLMGPSALWPSSGFPRACATF